MRVIWRWMAIGLLTAAAAAAAVLLGILLSFSRSDRICRGVAVSDIQVGGLTRAAAREIVRDWARERVAQQITLTALDTRWTGKLVDFGVRPEWNEAVDRAYAVGRRGAIIDRLVCVLSEGGQGKQIGAGIALDRSRLHKTVAKVAAAINRPHKDAKIKVVDGRLQIEQDQWGIKLNESEAVRAVMDAVLAGTPIVPMPIEADEPLVTATDVASIDTLLARFTTLFNPGKQDRTHNLSLAAERISGVVLKPGQEFSYNETVGPRLVERGYRDATIFVRGKLEPGLGGGVCQVSSTLYNTVLLAGLNVLERSPHSRTVPYVDPGRDATVAYGLRDFRFANSNPSSVAILTTVSGSQLTVDIYGAASDKKDITISTSKPSYVPAGSRIVIDHSLRPGQTKVVEEGAPGVTVTVYRKLIAADGTVKTEVVSKDKYPPHSKVIAVGRSRAAGSVLPVPASASGAKRAVESRSD